MLKWIGGMQAFCLVMGSLIGSVIGIIINPDNEISFILLLISVLLFVVYFMIMAIWVMPMFEKEKEEKRQAVLDNHAKLVDDTVDKVNVIYNALMDDLDDNGYSTNDVVIILDEIHSRVIQPEDDENEK